VAPAADSQAQPQRQAASGAVCLAGSSGFNLHSLLRQLATSSCRGGQSVW
jgi:hypothetical protein